MFLLLTTLVLAEHPAPAPSAPTMTRREYAAMLVIAEDIEARRSDRAHTQRLALLQTCRVGLTGELFGSAIKAKCDLAFASADAVRAGQPVTVSFHGGNVAVSVPQPWMMYGGAGYYANVVYGSPAVSTFTYRPDGAFDPSAEILRRLTSEVSTIRVETDNNSTLIDALTE